MDHRKWRCWSITKRFSEVTKTECQRQCQMWLMPIDIDKGKDWFWCLSCDQHAAGIMNYHWSGNEAFRDPGWPQLSRVIGIRNISKPARDWFLTEGYRHPRFRSALVNLMTALVTSTWCRWGGWFTGMAIVPIHWKWWKIRCRV